MAPLRRAWLGAVSSSVSLAMILASCGGPPAPGDPIACGNEQRLALDCASEIAYQGVKTGGGVEILSIGNANATYEEEAIREVNAELGRFVSIQTRLCREYNACVLSADEYKAQAAKTRATFETAAMLAGQLEKAETSKRKKVLGELYAQVVPDSARPEQLTVTMTIDAQLPEGLGSAQLVARPGAPLPTNARAAFTFTPSKPAYLYVYQVSPSGGVDVLFPNEALTEVGNPIPAGKPTRIPPGDRRFRLNEKDVGREHVYFLAAVAPIDAIDKVLAGAAKKAIRVDDDPLLAKLGKAGPAGSTPCKRGLELEACVGERGFELEPAKGSSMRARTELGDEVIVQVFPFEHVTEAEYPAKARDFAAGAERGIVIED